MQMFTLYFVQVPPAMLFLHVCGDSLNVQFMCGDSSNVQLLEANTHSLPEQELTRGLEIRGDFCQNLLTLNWQKVNAEGNSRRIETAVRKFR